MEIIHSTEKSTIFILSTALNRAQAHKKAVLIAAAALPALGIAPQ
jgi:hypothetical protein